MLRDKQKIQHRFDAASLTYDAVATVQEECAALLASTLVKQWPMFQPASMLDLGAGTGHASTKLLSCFPDAHLTVNDLSPNMLIQAKKKLRDHPHVDYMMGDLETLPLLPYDLIFSNLALQWTHNLEATLLRLYEASGVLAFSCVLDDTFDEWRALLSPSNSSSKKQSSPEHLMRYLLSLKPDSVAFLTRKFHLTFQGARSFMLYLKHLGASLGDDTVPFSHLKHLIQTHQDAFQVTYHVFFGFLKRLP